MAVQESEEAVVLLPHEEREVVLRADFDDLEPGDCCWVSLHFLRGPGRPQPGDWVYLLDCRGGGCVGTVAEVHGWIARVRPDWDTFNGLRLL
jgi:hypothetical protein